MALLTTTIYLEEAEVTEGIMSTLAAFVCSAYSPKASTSTQPLNCDGISSDNTRQKVTCALQQGGLKQHILRAHIQTRVWTEAAAGSTGTLGPSTTEVFYSQSQRPLRSNVGVNLTVHQADVQTVLICVSAASSVRTIRIPKLWCTKATRRRIMVMYRVSQAIFYLLLLFCSGEQVKLVAHPLALFSFRTVFLCCYLALRCYT